MRKFTLAASTPAEEKEKIHVSEMKVSEMITAIEEILRRKDEQIARYRQALRELSLKGREAEHYRDALKEIRDIALASEGVEFYAMLADRALNLEGFDPN